MGEGEGEKRQTTAESPDPSRSAEMEYVMNQVSIIGNLGTDVELRTVGDDKQVASFGVVVNRPVAKDESGNTPADFIPVVTWNGQAKSCSEYLTKGKKVGVTGRLKSRSWTTDDGSKRFALELVADRVEFLTPRSQNGSGPEMSEEDAATASTGGDDIPF